jgi:hypothetical protein
MGIAHSVADEQKDVLGSDIRPFSQAGADGAVADEKRHQYQESHGHGPERAFEFRVLCFHDAKIQKKQPRKAAFFIDAMLFLGD